MSYSWAISEPSRDHSWVIPEPTLDHLRIIHWINTVTLLDHPQPYLNQPWPSQDYPRVIHEPTLHSPRIILELCLNQLWSIPWSSLSYTWTNLGPCQEFWISRSQCIQGIYPQLFSHGILLTTRGPPREFIAYMPIIYILNSVLFCLFLSRFLFLPLTLSCVQRKKILILSGINILILMFYVLWGNHAENPWVIRPIQGIICFRKSV